MQGRVAIWTGPREPFEFREYPVADPQPDTILVRLRTCNVCGSDVHLWRGDTAPLKSGQVLGHEMVGTIEKLGSAIHRDTLGQPLEEGDRVVYGYARHCGRCRYCLTREAPCPYRNRHWIGVSSDEAPHFHAGFGEFYYVRPGQAVFRVGQELPDRLVSPINCAGAQVAEGLEQVGVNPGESVIVQGAGSLGLYAIAMAREAGAKRIIVFDGHPARLEFAQRFGADHVVDIGKNTADERREQVLDWTDGFGADLALELAGVPQAVAEGVTLLRQGGRYLIAGNINSGHQTAFDPTEIVRRRLVLKGSHGYEPGALARALEFLGRTRERYPYEAMVSHQFALEAINDAFALADRGEGRRLSIDFGMS